MKNLLKVQFPVFIFLCFIVMLAKAASWTEANILIELL